MAEQIVGPIPPDYHYERVVDGVVVETMPGTGVLPGGSGLATTSIDDTGSVVTPQIKRADPAAPPPPGQLDQLSGQGTGGSFEPGATSYSNRTSYPRHSSGSGSYRGGTGGYSGASGSGGGSFGSGSSGQGPVPRYADNTTHPFFGGPPRIPGGSAAAQDQGQGYRTPAYVPSSGAYAGEGEVRAANPPESRYDGGGGGTSAGGGGGGGGGASPLYWKLRNQLTGGGSSSSYTDSTKQYRRQSRRSDRAWEQYNDELYNPDPLPVHGWAKQQGYKPGSVEAALADPTAILGEVFPGYTRQNTQGGTAFDELGMTDIALAAAGTGKRGLTTKTPVVKPPPILRQQGVKPEKPENPRILDPSAVVNEMAGLYGAIGAQDPNGGQWFDTNALLHNLANTKKKSAVGMQIGGMFEEDPGSAIRTATQMVQSILGTAPSNLANMANQRTAEQVMSNISSDLMRRNPKKGYRAVSELAKQFLV